MRTREAVFTRKRMSLLRSRSFYATEPEHNRYHLSCWPVPATMVAEFIAIGALRTTIGSTQKVWPVLAPTTMQPALPSGGAYAMPPERAEHDNVRGSWDQHARVRQGTAAKKEGGSLIRGAEESDRIAALASAETQVRARASSSWQRSLRTTSSDWCASLVSRRHRVLATATT